MSNTAQDQWSAIQTQVDNRLRQYCEEQRKKSSDQNGPEARLWELLQQVILAGGKRLRPYLVMLAYEAYGGTEEKKILDVAMAWELLHQAMLIHDDIIDRDYVRHGTLNVAGTLIEQYDKAATSTDRAHLANSGAILAGDLSLSSAYQAFLGSGFEVDLLRQALQDFGTATSTVIGGELLDTEAVMQAIGDTDSLLIAEMKTASYSFVGPLHCGAILAGASEKDLRTLAKLGHALGIAFQLDNDIQGMFGDEKATGKSSGGDIREGKRTLLVQYAAEASEPTERALIESVLGNPKATKEEVEEFRYIVKSSGALERTRFIILEQLDQADDLLEQLGITDRSVIERFEIIIAKLRHH